MVAEVLRMMISLVLKSMDDEPSAAPINGMATCSSSGTWAMVEVRGPGCPLAKNDLTDSGASSALM